MKYCQQTNCRSCGAPLHPDILLRYDDMPGAAQHLPLRAENDRGVDLRIRQCGGCGLIQLDGAPVSYYREVIRAAAFSPEMKQFRLEQFRHWLADYGLAGGKILECGCGGGEYLSLMAECGANAFGIEFGDENLTRCRAKGLRVEKCYFEGPPRLLPDAPFDGFYILNYLEHLPNLGEYLQGIAANLKGNAVGLVEVPNFDMMLANATFAEFTSDHLYYFTARTLTGLLERNGFDVLTTKVIWYGYILSAVVRKRPLPDLSSFEIARQELTGKLKALIEKYGSENTAVWGASHQAFAILALAGLHGKIRCVIDSASFKQGKLTPATHIPIVPPDAIKPGELQLLIAAAGGYSDEVAKLARQQYGTGLKIYILRENDLECHTGDSF